MLANIKISSFTGNSLRLHLSSIARLRAEVFSEFPYLQHIDMGEEKSYLEKYIQCKEAIAVVVFDGSTVVGVSTGTPLIHESPILQKPFIDRELDPTSYFYFSESVLLKPYRGRGIGHHFFDIREEHAKSYKSFRHLCFCTIDRPEDHPLTPSDYMPLNDFWRKRGFVQHPEMSINVITQDTNEEYPSEKTKSVWIKDLYTSD